MIVDWQEIADERSGELDQLRAIRHYTRCFRIITDSTLDGPETILLNSEFLGLLTIYLEANGAADPGAILRTVRVSQPHGSDNPFVWILTYEYSSEPLDPQQRGGANNTNTDPDGNDDDSPPGQGVQDPLARPPIFSIEPSKFQRVMDADATGASVTNSAGMPFSPQPEADETRLVLTMERNEDEPDWPVFLAYQDAVNSDVFMGFPPGTAKVNIRAQSMFENNLYYWKMTYVFELRNVVMIQGTLFSGWDKHIQDRGFSQLGTNNLPEAIRDSNGTPVSEPVLLDGTGHAAASALGVVSVKVLTGGAGYPAINTVTFSGGGGAGAAGVAVVNGVGAVSAVIVTSSGVGYTSAPTATVTSAGGGGAGATVSVQLGPAAVYRHYRPYNWLPFAEAFCFPTEIS